MKRDIRAAATWICLLIVIATLGCSRSRSALENETIPTPFAPTASDVMAAMQLDGLIAQQESLERIYFDTPWPSHNGADATWVRDLAGSQLATVYSFQGDYLAATRVFPETFNKPIDLKTRLPDTNSHEHRNAVDVVERLAASRQLVIINEAHHVAKTRWLPLLLLPRLRRLGYQYLALEALSEDGPDIARRGYANRLSGSYTNEPIYAEIVRAALAQGFRLVRYDSSPVHGAADRESAQADRIARIFRADPEAKVFILAGYRHASKNDEADMGGTLATRLQQITGLEPVSVDQTAMLAKGSVCTSSQSLPCAFQPAVPSALISRDSTPWSLDPRHYDVTILLPPSIEQNGRPSWLTLGGLRTPYQVTGALCRGNFPCVVEARRVSDGADAVPTDLFVLRGERQQAELYLMPGTLRLEVFNNRNELIAPAEIVDIEVPVASFPPAHVPRTK